MSNPNPKTEQLELGRGKRPSLDHQTVSMRMSPTTKEILEQIALKYNCVYANKGWIAGLLEKIASGKLIIVPAPPGDYCSDSNPKELRNQHLKKKITMMKPEE